MAIVYVIFAAVKLWSIVNSDNLPMLQESHTRTDLWEIAFTVGAPDSWDNL